MSNGAREAEQYVAESHSIEELLRGDDFLSALLDALPTGVLVVDADHRVRAVNRVVEQTFGVRADEVRAKSTGDVLRCLYALQPDEGDGSSCCGETSHCRDHCEFYRAALEALGGGQVRRRRTEVRVWLNGRVQDRVILTSAAPTVYQGESLAIVLLEDITDLDAVERAPAVLPP